MSFFVQRVVLEKNATTTKSDKNDSFRCQNTKKFYAIIMLITFTLVKRIGIAFFSPLTFFRIHSKFSDFWSRFCM